MASSRTYWAAHGSPPAKVKEDVAPMRFVTGVAGSPDTAKSYKPPADKDLHIVSIGMSVEPAAQKVNGRVQMRKGKFDPEPPAPAPAPREVPFWSYPLVAAANGDSASEVFSFPEGTFVIPAGQEFCFTVKTGDTPTTIHFVAVGYLEPRTA